MLGHFKWYYVQIFIAARGYIDKLLTKISNELLKKKHINFEFEKKNSKKSAKNDCFFQNLDVCITPITKTVQEPERTKHYLSSCEVSEWLNQYFWRYSVL